MFSDHPFLAVTCYKLNNLKVYILATIQDEDIPPNYKACRDIIINKSDISQHPC